MSAAVEQQPGPEAWGLTVESSAVVGNQPDLSILVHGPSGAGKTYLARTTGDLEHTLVLAAEPGLLTLRDVNLPVVQVSTIERFQRAFSWLRSGHHNWRWVIVDSISEVAEAILGDEKKSSRDGRKAYGEMQDRVIALCKAFRDLPMHVVMLCKQERVQDDQGRLVYVPSLPGKKLAQNVPYLFDEVLALRAEATAGPDGAPAVSRFMQTAHDGQHEAKDRSGSLAFYEAPDLAAIAAKILPPKEQTS